MWVDAGNCLCDCNLFGVLRDPVLFLWPWLVRQYPCGAFPGILERLIRGFSATKQGELDTVKITLFASLLILTAFAVVSAAEFESPVRLQADGKPVNVGGPGFAAPCWADVDGDGKKDLLVGQFSRGRIRFYKNLGENKLAKSQWLQAEGKIVQIPGVW